MLSSLVIRRKFASAASTAAKTAATVKPRVIEEKVTEMPDGLTVASVDLQGPVSQLVMAFRAGSRYEQPDEAGIVHFLRNVIGTDSQRYSGLKLLWQSGSIGSNVISSASKDLLIVQLSVVRTHDKIGISILGEISQPAMKPWDVTSRVETLQSDLTHQTPEDLVIENLHKAAYRNGPLATPLLSPAHQIGKRSYKQLRAYMQSRLTSKSAALVGINVDHSVLTAYAQEQKPVPTSAEGLPKAAVQSPYFGGDVRVTGNTPIAHVAIAGQGARLTDIKSVAVQAVLAALIGKGPNTKMVTSFDTGIVSEHIIKAANHNPLSLSAVNVVHSDNGLIGVYLTARGDQVAPLIRAAMNGFDELSNKGPSNEALANAKKSVAVDVMTKAESSSALAQDIAAQVLANGKTVDPNQFLQLVNSVTTEEVKKAAAQLLTKISVSAYGRINQVPYADVI